MTEKTEALIAEARRLENDYGDNYEVMTHMSALADALEAATRQPSEDDREVVANHLREIGATCMVGEPCGCADCENASEWVSAPLAVVLDHVVPLAAVPDAATEREIAVIEEHREKWMARAFRAETERDAALAAIERVRELHREGEHECVECSFESMHDVGFRGVSVPWPCRTIQALDEAPEPEEKP